MKKLILILTIIAVFFVAIPAYATWTIHIIEVGKTKNHLYWRALCTSDGSALSATDLIAIMPPKLKKNVQNSTMLIMDVVPGTGSVIPDTTINVTLTNVVDLTIYAATGFSKDAATVGNDLSNDYGQYPAVYSKLNLALNDIGTSGDQVTLYFECWIEAD